MASKLLLEIKWNHKIKLKRKDEKKKGTKKLMDKQKTTRNMIDLNTAILLIIFNINGLNIPIKDRDCSQKKKQGPTVCSVQEIHIK